MQSKISLIGACALLLTTAGPVRAQQTLELDNGDRLSGQLTKIDGATWVFASTVGEVKVPAARVTAFVAPDPVGIRLSDGTIAAVTISSQNGRLVVTRADGTTIDATPADLAAVGSPAALEALRPVEVGFFSPIRMFWGATGALGISNKSGNSRSRGTSVDLEIRRVSPKDRLTLNAGVNRELRPNDQGELQLAVSKYYGALRADVYVSPRMFAFAETQQERDTFQLIDLRSSYVAGLGVQAVTTPTTDLRFSLSGGARIENFVGPTSESAAVGSFGTDLRQKLGPATLAWKAAWAPNVEDLGNYRLRSTASITTTLIKGLGFRVGLLNEYNSRPQPGIEKHDWMVTTTLAYSVGTGS
jgi:putative salt-induced outer membrane protein YdiY